MPPEVVSSVCPHDCPSTCALDVERLSPTRVGAVRGAASNGYTSGVVCAKVARYAERVHHPDRLATPLRRTGPKGAGRFAPISWDDALDIVAENLTRAAERYGSESVWPFFYAGTMGLVQRDGIERLRHVMRYSRQHSTYCVALADAGWMAGIGSKWGAWPEEMEEADLIVIWGGNPVATQVHVMTHATRARKARGAKIVCVDPYRSGTAEAADIHLCLRPGTDGALACAVMHVLLKEGYADRDYLARLTDFDAEVEAHLAARTPAWAAEITGLSEEEIVSFARLYGSTKRSFLRVGYGFTRQRNGSAAMHAVSCLPAVTGAWQHRGGGALYSNGGIYGLDKTVIMGLDALDRSVRIIDQCRIGPALLGEKADLGDGPPIKALFIQNTNPAVVAPDLGKVHRGFAREDLFTCVHEQFLTDTARWADIVLPATTFLEHADMYMAGGHTYLQVTRPVIEPYAEARSNHEVICGLAKRLGATHPGFEMSAWELIDRTLKDSGLPGADEVADGRWIDRRKTFESAHFLDGFGTPDRRFHFKPDWSRVGPRHAAMPRMPDHLANIEAADAEHPFRMMASPARQFLNSTFTETPTSRKREVRPTALIHPDDCAALGVSEGDPVRLGNRRGSVVVHARPFDGLQRGVTVVEGIWPGGAFVEGRALNTLMGSDAPPPNGGGAFHDTAVWIRREEVGE